MKSTRHKFTPLELTAIGISIVLVSFLVLDPVVYNAVRELGPGVHTFFRSFTHIGRTNWILIPSGIAILVLAWLRARESGFRSGVILGYASQLLVFVFAAIALSGLSASLLKNVIGRARPKLFTSHGPLEFQPMNFDADFASFPSGHSATAGALAAVLAIMFPRWRVLFFVAGAWVASTRVFIGAHFASDVAAGFLFGALFVYLIRNRLAHRGWLFRVRGNGEIVMRGRALIERAAKRIFGAAGTFIPARPDANAR